MRHTTNRSAILCALLLLALLAVPLAAQAPAPEPRGRSVLIEHLSVAEEARELSTVADVVTETIALSLRIMGEWEVLSDEGGAASGGAEIEDPYVIGGEAIRLEDRSIRFVLRVRGPDRGEPLFETTQTADTLFDVFYAADEAVIALLGGLNDRSVRFGTLQIVPDATVPYSVSLNDTTVAEDVSGTFENSRIVAGTYRLRVTQERLLGNRAVLEQEVTVPPGASHQVALRVPSLIPEEQEYLAEAWSRGAADSARERLLSATGLREQVRSAVDHFFQSEAAGSRGAVSGTVTPSLSRGRLPGAAAAFGEDIRFRAGAAAPRVLRTLEQYVGAHYTRVGEYWSPAVGVHVGPDGSTHLGFGLEGLTGAKDVTVNGPSHTGISDFPLTDEEAIINSGAGDGHYNNYLTEAEALRPGDEFVISWEHEGVDLSVPVTVGGFSRELVEEMHVASVAEGIEVTWTPLPAARQHTVVLSEVDQSMPAPPAWIWSESVDGAEGTMLVPADVLRGRRHPVLRLHLFSADANWNHVWTSKRISTLAAGRSARDVPRRTITVDGSPEDWAGLPTFGTPRPVAFNGEMTTVLDALYLAADAEYMYWAIDIGEHDVNLRRIKPQLQIYTTFDDEGRKNGAWLTPVENGDNAWLSFDPWDTGRPREIRQNVSAASSATFLEGRFPRGELTNEFEMNCVIWPHKEAAEAVHPTGDFWVRLP